MLRHDFHYDLPTALIAQTPPAERGASRLLCVNGTANDDRRFTDLLDLLRPGDLLVLNDTRVIPARVYGHKASGGRIEVLVERVLGNSDFLAQIRASKPPLPGSVLHLAGDTEARVIERHGEMYRLQLAGERTVLAWLEACGEIPLPPYIQRTPTPEDAARYQTVYARAPGAVAAPTAGLHFDAPMLARLQERGVEIAHVTLHVGAGTFQPVRAERLEDHHMHPEYAEVSPAVCAAVATTRARGGRVVAVGTTAVRALESAAASGNLQPYAGDTRLFISPGYTFHVVDALITNFHLPESTLLMLVCAFGGYARMMAAYRHAVAAQYRFFSYGDAMFVERAA